VHPRDRVRDVKAEREREEREEATREIATQQDPLGFNELREQLMGSAVDYDIDEGDKRAHIAQARKGGKELGVTAVDDDDDAGAGSGSGSGGAGGGADDDAHDDGDGDEHDAVPLREPLSDIEDDD
jgi:hypothetical protein